MNVCMNVCMSVCTLFVLDMWSKLCNGGGGGGHAVCIYVQLTMNFSDLSVIIFLHIYHSW